MAERVPERRLPAEQGPGWRTWLLLVVGAILVVFVALNSQEVEVNFIVGSAEMPLIFALVIAAALGALVGWALPRLRGPRE
jgi:uncharacterized integral membrane protein